MKLVIDHPGMQSTVQDLGRAGHRSQGIPAGGAVDALAMRAANLLVGNAEHLPVLECALSGPEIHFTADATIAICGATAADVPSARPVLVRRRQRVSLRSFGSGRYAYIAVAGGICVPPVLGSASTELRSGFGGHLGRALRAGDTLQIGAPSAKVISSCLSGDWQLNLRPFYLHHPARSRRESLDGKSLVVRFIHGVEFDEFDQAWLEASYTISARSDRMGLRLAGPALVRKGHRELASSPVAPGTMQVPPDGQPIVLLADAQTIGGYPRIGHVASVDLPGLAQCKIGMSIHFQPISLAEAHQLLLEQSGKWARLCQGIAEKLS